jgi:hypothetical protein
MGATSKEAVKSRTINDGSSVACGNSIAAVYRPARRCSIELPHPPCLVISSAGVLDKIVPAVKDIPFEISATTLSKEQEDKLRAAFGQ